MANTTPDPKRLILAINDATSTYKGDTLDIDAADVEPTENPDGSFSLEMTKFIDEPAPRRRPGPGGRRPIGIIRYTVTVVGKFESFNDE